VFPLAAEIHLKEDGTSADRQLAALERSGDMIGVVKQLISETNDLPEL
jgi:hypothetical protein